MQFIYLEFVHLYMTSRDILLFGYLSRSLRQRLTHFRHDIFTAARFPSFVDKIKFVLRVCLSIFLSSRSSWINHSNDITVRIKG